MSQPTTIKIMRQTMRQTMQISAALVLLLTSIICSNSTAEPEDSYQPNPRILSDSPNVIGGVSGSKSGDSSAGNPLLFDTFAIPLKIRHAESLFAAKRYRDAEALFGQIRTILAEKAIDSDDRWTDQGTTRYFDSYVSVLDYLAQSRSQQGKAQGVLALMSERHDLINTHYHRDGYQFANSLGRIAEAHYRQGNPDKAVPLIRHAIKIYSALNPVPATAMDLARRNLSQYLSFPFSTSRLPMDLSEFYSRCELINSGDTNAQADALMGNFVEVGVDFVPKGSWVTYFSDLKLAASTDSKATTERRIFIPAIMPWAREEICLIDVDSGVVISAESSIE